MREGKSIPVFQKKKKGHLFSARWQRRRRRRWESREEREREILVCRYMYHTFKSSLSAAALEDGGGGKKSLLPPLCLQTGSGKGIGDTDSLALSLGVRGGGRKRDVNNFRQKKSCYPFLRQCIRALSLSLSPLPPPHHQLSLLLLPDERN